MAKLRRQQTLMDSLNQTGLTSTPIPEYLDNMTSCITQQITDSTTKLEDLIKHQGSDIDQLRYENKALKAQHLIDEGRLTRVEKELLKVQQHSMKENLIFQNIPEKQQENVNTILREYMKYGTENI